MLLADAMGLIKEYSLMAKHFFKNDMSSQANGNINNNVLYLEQIGIS